MRWIVAACLLLFAPALVAGEGKVIKVLPLYLDSKGHDSLNPSLYERDAYQALLRKHPDQRHALRFVVQWKASKVNWSNVCIVVENRGVQGNSFVNRTIQHPVRRIDWFSKWESIDITGKDFETMGELAAWRVTLREGDTILGEQKSFLW
jgi:hypothetical protein